MALLIVDDDASNRELLSRRLEHEGFEVWLAEDGPKAVSSLRGRMPDLVLLDVRMPGMTGLRVLRAIRDRYSASELPVIMVTAESQSASVVKALQMGANDYITKPLDIPVALARIRAHLAHKTYSAALRESEERYARAARGSNDGLWDWDLDAGEVYFSPRWKQMLGYQEEEIGSRSDEWFCRVHPADLDRLQAALTAHYGRESQQLDCEYRIHCKDGTYRWMHSRALAVWDDHGHAVRIAGSQTDITASKVFDPLTGLPNLLLFMDRLERRLELAQRHAGHAFAILLLDVDRFKNVNDSLGHTAGDLLLQLLARRLRDALRASDTVARLQEDCGVARLAGDEFAVLLNDLGQPTAAAAIAERIGNAMRAPFVLNDNEVFVSASMGIAASLPGYQCGEDLLRDAGTALHCAKVAGRARYEVFDSGMRQKAITRLQVESDLRRAIDREELRLYYQPIVDLRTNTIKGFEALVRWQHPQRGLVFPGDFIPLAEETRLIIPAGRWILEQACRDAYRWPRTGLTLHVNVSPVQLTELSAMEEIERILRNRWPVATGCGLSLEITEGTMMRNSERVATLLGRLHDLHIGLDIDDFGTGYSSLSQLQLLPVQTLKIDRAFISRLGRDEEGLAIVRTIVALAHNLGMNVVAEGVETDRQLALVKAMGCEYAQGYYFGKPTDRETACSLLAPSACDLMPSVRDPGRYAANP